MAPAAAGALKQIAKAFGQGKSLYDILQVPREATSSAIRKAYFRIALTCHPDKCPGDAEATAKFQALSMIHATLSDEEKRKVYDETGQIVGDDDLHHTDREWYDYYRNLFPRVTMADIDKFQKEYQGSEEEKEDVLQAYEKWEGSMAGVISEVMLAADDDEERLRAIIEEAIHVKKVKRYKAFKKLVKNDAKRQAKAAKEAKEAEALLAAIQQKRGNTSLANLAQNRQEEFSSFIAALESKYAGDEGGGGGKGEGKKKREGKGGEDWDIPDEEFDRLQAEIGRKKKKKGKE